VVAPPPERARGQATVELALALPFVAAALLVVVQVLLVALAQLRVDHAAREAARAASVDPRPEAAASAVVRQQLGPDRAQAEVVRGGEQVVVTVRFRVATEVPIVGALVGDLALTARAAFRDETAGPLP
jgi:Flp pilus assembly protein TadG